MKDLAPIVAALAICLYAPSMDGMLVAILVGTALALVLYRIEQA